MTYHKQFILDQFAPIAVYSKLRKHYKNEISFLFESAGNSGGNYSFIAIGAQERLSYKNKTTTYTSSDNETITLKQNPFDFLKEYYKGIDKKFYQDKAVELGIGLVDGFIGYIGYDAVQIFEPVLEKSMKDLKDTLNLPDIDLMRPKLILVYSHKDHKITLLSSLEEIQNGFDLIESLLKSPYIYEEIIPIQNAKEGSFAFDETSFHEMVHKSKEMIRSGDVFQILMSNRYTLDAKVDPFSFYRILRAKNPSPYLFFMEFEDFTIAGSSPEVMVGLNNGDVLLRPIAGTRKRGKTPARDAELEAEMLADPKECAEHLMLVDLGRNDLGRVAEVGSVKATEMMRVEKYSHVMHMVSDLYAKLDTSKYDMFDLFAATFTAGTMTGAPKIRAMELIAEFEGIKRSYYSGSVGYFGFDGNMDTAITIRTSLITENSIVFQAGAGVVADSQPELEYLEVQNKLGALISSLDELKA